VLNRTEWMGKEPRSCAVTSVKSRSRAAGDPSPIVFDIEVSYRPKGQISYVGSTRYDGWTAMIPDETTDPPSYLRQEVYDDVEFNDLEFGEFIGETGEDGVKHVTAETVMNEIMTSGKFSASVHRSFMAPRRSRPYKKIVLSGSPSGEFIDGFGTHIVNINNTTPNLEQLLTDSLIGLMCEFVEGKASIKSIGIGSITHSWGGSVVGIRLGI